MNGSRMMHRANPAEKIVIAGSGNVAGYLAASLNRAGHTIDLVYSRTATNARKLAEKVNARWTSNISELSSHEGIWIFALTDQATFDTINSLGFKKGFLLHTAGSLPLDIFDGHSDQHGVLYPLQTFSVHRSAAFPGAPICIESNTRHGLERLRKLALSISNEVYEAGSDERLLLHAGAVFACNFSNHMYTIASDIAKRAGLPFKLYHKLIKETAEKALEIHPSEAQTGPAQRNDQIIIKKHLDLLSFSPELQIIYSKLTEEIRNASLIAEHRSPEKKTIMGNFKEDLSRVKAFVFDVDGVFSDGILLVNPDGELTRSMNIKDGFAVQLAVKQGYPIGIITGANSESIRKRFETLGVNDVYLKSSRKFEDFTHFCNKHNLDHESVMYMGDDLPDYPVMERVGFPVCPMDAVHEIKQIACYISGRNGGDGCVRDVIEQVMRTHGKWMNADSFVL